MNLQHVAALLAVELKREGPLTVRMLVVVLGLMVVFTLAGRGGAETMSAVLIGSTLGYAVLVPMALFRDKIDGSLEFLCFLPTTPREIVSARLAAVAIVSIPGAIQIAVAFAIFGAPLGLVPDPAAVTVALFFLGWIGLTLGGLALLALITNFRLQTLLGKPLVAVALVMIALPIVTRRVDITPVQAAEWVLARVPAPVALGVLVVGGTAALGVGLFAAATHGVAVFRPRPDEIQL